MINKKSPNVFVGAPATRLGPQVGTIKQWPSPIAIEIKDGIGIGVDGESIVVGHGKKGKIEIIGHTDDGFYPQRDYEVTRDNQKTKVDGYFDWLDYNIKDEDKKTHIQGNSERETFEVAKQDDSLAVSGKYPVQNYKIDFKKNEVDIDGYDYNNLYDTKLVTEGNVTKIQNEHEERCFTVTREENKMKFDGKYAFQDFEVTWDDKQIVVKGHYPQQKVVIKFKD